MPWVVFSAYDTAKLFAETISDNSNLDGSGISLPGFASRANLKLRNIPVTPMLVKNMIINFDSLNASGPDCIPVVVLESSEPEYLSTLANLCKSWQKESHFLVCWRVSSLVSIIGEKSGTKNYLPVSLLLVVSKIFGKLFNNRGYTFMTSTRQRVLGDLEICHVFADFIALDLLFIYAIVRGEGGVTKLAIFVNVINI